MILVHIGGAAEAEQSTTWRRTRTITTNGIHVTESGEKEREGEGGRERYDILTISGDMLRR